MTLSDLLQRLATLDARTGAIAVAGVTADSRMVKPGDVFVAVPGTKADGLAFAAQAAAAGAAAIVGEGASPALPHGTPFVLKLFIAPVEFISFLVRPFSLGLRPFIAMFAGHVLLDVFGNFVVQGLNAGGPVGYGIGALAFVFVIGVNALELLVGAIQAFVFALLTALYIKDAVHLH